MAKVDDTTLEQEAFTLAESGFLAKGFKSGSANFSGAQQHALVAYVMARLLKRHPHVSVSHLHDIAEYGVAKAFATQGQMPSDIPLSPLAAVGGQIVGDYNAVKHTGESISDFLGKLSDPTTWLRGLYIIGGGTLVLSGVFIVAKELGASAPTPPIYHAKKLLGK